MTIHRGIPEPPDLHVSAHRGDGLTTLAVAGEMDVATADDFAATVREHLADGPVMLELRELSFMDSSGVRALDGLLRDVEREGWSLQIRSDLTENVRRLLSLTGLLDALPLRDPPSP